LDELPLAFLEMLLGSQTRRWRREEALCIARSLGLSSQ
jgi:hypothetical protein